MIDLVCPFCGWDLNPEYDDNMAYCPRCKEWVVAEPREGDVDPFADFDSDNPFAEEFDNDN